MPYMENLHKPFDIEKLRAESITTLSTLLYLCAEDLVGEEDENIPIEKNMIKIETVLNEKIGKLLE